MSEFLFALEWLPEYRVSFLDRLRRQVADDGHQVQVVYGQPPSNKADRHTDANLSWGHYVRNRRVSLGGIEFAHQPVSSMVRQADFVIVQQEASLPLNWALASGAVKARKGWAMWGHGQHFNPLEVSVPGEYLKRVLTRRADWFFAYTDSSRDAVVEFGIPQDQVTVVNNSSHAPLSESAGIELPSFVHSVLSLIHI